MDQIGNLLVPFATIQAAAMIATEWGALPVLKDKKKPGANLPWRKRLTCFVYSTGMAGVAVPAGLLDMGEANPWFGVPLMGVIVTILATGLVKGKQALSGR